MKLTTATCVVTISALSFCPGIGEGDLFAATGTGRIVVTSQPLRGYSVDVSINGQKVATVNPYRPYRGEIPAGETRVAVEGKETKFIAKPGHEYVLEITMIPPSDATALFLGLFAPPSGYLVTLKKTIEPEAKEKNETRNSMRDDGLIPQKGGQGPITNPSLKVPATQTGQVGITPDPSIAADWRELARHFLAAGENDKAMGAYENADRFDPGNADTLEALGALYARAGRQDSTKQVWERLKQIDSARAERFFSIYIQP